MKKVSLLLLSLFYFSSSGAQNHMKVYEHLDYINQQFKDYNEYDTRWEIDFAGKKLIAHDKFQSMTGSILATEVTLKEGSSTTIGFYCLSGKCLKSSKEQEDPYYSSYTMGLSQNVDEVLRRFEEIKREFGGTVSYKGGSSKSLSSSDIGIINENLAYINLQFSRYNKYNTSFRLSDNYTVINCTDKFGTLSANISDVGLEFNKDSKTILKIYCADGTKCLKNTETGEDYSSYTMGLKEDEEPVYEAEIVIEKFAELKRLATKSGGGNDKTGGDSYNPTKIEYSNSTKANVERALDRLTEIFQEHNTYKHRWFVDWDKMYVYSKTRSCEVYIPIGQGTSITKKEKGYYFSSPSKGIREKCSSFDNYVDKTNNNLNTDAAADEVVMIFQEILDITKSGGGSDKTDGDSYNPTKREYSNSTKANVEEALDRMTEIFQEHNTYKHRWFVDWNKMYMYSKTSLCEVYIPIGQGTSITKKEKGYYFSSPSKGIREKCSSFDNYVIKTNNNLNTDVAADEVVMIFQEILDMTR
jgi:ribosome-associated translation inhibitor RaiA